MIRQNRILIVDDEPSNIEWLVEYVVSKGFECNVASTVSDAITELKGQKFFAVIVDMNIPVGALKFDQGRRASDHMFGLYPGLYVAEFARNHGHSGRYVFFYTVHYDDSLLNKSKDFGCTYLLKGRPRSFKQELDRIL